MRLKASPYKEMRLKASPYKEMRLKASHYKERSVRLDQKSNCAPNFTSRASKVDVGRCHVAPFVP